MFLFLGFQLSVNLVAFLNNNLVICGRINWSIEKNALFWKEQGQKSVEEALKVRENTRIAKNIILFVGDGMGVSSVTAGRIRKGQMKGELGEDFITEMDRFPYLGLVKTYAY